MPLGNSPASSFHLILGILPCILLIKIAVALFFVHTPINTINYVIFNKEKLMGTQHTVVAIIITKCHVTFASTNYRHPPVEAATAVTLNGPSDPT